MNELLNLGGWHFEKNKFEKVCQDAGYLVDVAPWIKDSGEGKTVVLWKAVKELTGNYFAYKPQTRGTCVGRAGGRSGDILKAIEYLRSNARCDEFKKVSSEAVYALARVEIGGGRIRGDGAVVSDAIEAVRRYGFIERGKHVINGQEFTIPPEDDDSLAVAWGSPRNGLPDPLEKIAAEHRVQQYAVIRNYEDARDAIANGFVVWFGTSVAFWWSLPAKRDRNGFLRRKGRTAHSWIAVGVNDDNQKPGILLDNKSWGDDWVTGPKGQIDIPDGCYWCTPEDFNALVKAGEAFAISNAGFAPIGNERRYVLL